MHYAYDVPVYPVNTVDNHFEVPVILSAGILRHVTIRFPPGCARLVNCSIWDASEQRFPTNMEAVYCEDSYAVEIDCYLPTWLYGNEFTILAWSLGTGYLHVLRVLMYVQSVEEPDLAATINNINTVTDSMISVLKGFY